MTPKGFTYFCTDRHGNTYTRFSAQHAEPTYTFAAVYRREGTTAPVAKANVTYSRKRGTAEGVARRFQGMEVKRSYKADHLGVTKWMDDPHRLEAEVVPVRAYPGRHSVEPRADQAEAA
jgi:hypothetical protein